MAKVKEGSNPYKFTAKIHSGRSKRKPYQKQGKLYYWAVLHGLNGEPVFVSETQNNRKDILDLLLKWFPRIVFEVVKFEGRTHPEKKAAELLFETGND